MSAIFLACDKMGINDARGRHIVRRWLGTERKDWPPCCGGSCTLCNKDVLAAVELTLRYLDDA
jgi:hypothetical protein